VTSHSCQVLTTLENLENLGNFLILENSGILNLLRGIFVSLILFVISLTLLSVVLDITSAQQNFAHLVKALYEAHCVTAQVADSAKVQFSRHAP